MNRIGSIYCDCCGQQMRLKEKLPSKKSKKSGSVYRVRRYWCELCKIQKTVFADGYRDEVAEIEYAKGEILLIQKQEEENRTERGKQ